MKALIFGNPDSIWIKTVLERTLIQFHDDATILATRDNTVYADYYRENAVRVVPCKKMKGKIGTLLSGFTNLPVIREGYDVFCMHFVTNLGLCVLITAKMFCKRTILFFWGSDILRTEKRTLLKMAAFHLADYISIGTKEMLDKFHELYGHSFDGKIVKINFGVTGLDMLEKAEKNFDRIKIRRKYHVDDDKIAIAIGYNKRKGQQHLDVLRAIRDLPPEIRQKIHLILRLTYGDEEEDYVNSIKRLVDETECSSTIIESFLEDEEIAEITALTDMLIHAQITDARSASMQEHLYAGCLVANASWIRYSELEDQTFYLTFDSFEDIKSIIADNLQPKENSKYRDLLVKNKRAISELSAWDVLAPAWRELYSR